MRARLARICLWTGLVGIALLSISPLLLAALGLVTRGVLHVDYLVSAELGAVALGGSTLLLIGTVLKKSPYLTLALGLLIEFLGLALMVLNPSLTLAWVGLVLYNISLVLLVFHAVQALG